MLEELLYLLAIPGREEHQVSDAVLHPRQQVVRYHDVVPGDDECQK